MKKMNDCKDDCSVKLFNVSAVILVMHDSIPSGELLTEWEENGAHITLVLGGGLSAKRSTREIRDLPKKVRVVDIKDEIKRNKVSARIKEAIMHTDAEAKRTILLTDHPAAVAGGRRKGLYTIIGLTLDKENLRPFYDEGANLVIHNPEQLEIIENSENKTGFIQEIPGLFKNKTSFESRFGKKKPVFFFDYDGTLASIVKDPEKAYITDTMRNKLADLAKNHSVSVVSGRDKSDIEDFVQLEEVIYAGSHGFRITGPDGLYMEQENAEKLLPGLDEMEEELRIVLEQKIEGVQVERKYFAIAIHYRNAPPGTYKKIVQEVNRLISDDPDFKKGRGKKILEIKPALDWHKGKALEWIMNHLDLSFPDESMPVYIGDDVTDEDAFRALADDGIGILVGKHSQLSAAKYHLDDVEQVEEFLEFLLNSDRF